MKFCQLLCCCLSFFLYFLQVESTDKDCSDKSVSKLL